MTKTVLDKVMSAYVNNSTQNTLSKKQLGQLSSNCTNNSITLYELGHKYNGLVHVIKPEMVITPLRLTTNCGASHASLQVAFGTIAFGNSTNQVAQVFSNQ